MASDLRKYLGNYVMLKYEFAELEVGVAATTKLVYEDGGDAGDPPMLFDGWIVGIGVGCEAGSNFTLQVTVNGTPDTGTTWTVNAAKETERLKESDWVSFSEGDTIGAYVVADTTSKDVKVAVYVLLNVGEDPQ